MHCFFCANKKVFNKLHLKIFSVPICSHCVEAIPKEILYNYKIGKKPFFKTRTYIGNGKIVSTESNCDICGKGFSINPVFGDFGFDISVCNNCLRDPLLSLRLRNLHLKYYNTW